MTSAYVLILAVLILGGVLAVLGDRIGSKVGKARLRLFGLRPRKTAVVMTILTGTTIAASTLGILFALSESLRDGIFKLDEIITELRTAQVRLMQARQEQEQVSQELEEVTQDRERVERGLKDVRQRFQETNEQTRNLGNQVKQLQAQRERLVAQIPQLQEQVRQRDRTIRDRDGKIAEQDRILRDRASRLADLENQRNLLQAEIGKRDTKIQSLDTTIADRDTALQGQEETLESLDRQLSFLRDEVSVLERDRQNLRQGNVVLARGEVLSEAVFRVVEPASARSAVDVLLQSANRRAIEATRSPESDPDERVVFITQAQVEQLIARIQDGQEYVVRILSAENYVEQEERVRVFADVAFNERVFREGEIVATVSVAFQSDTREDIKEHLNVLLSSAQTRARNVGLLGTLQIEEGQVATFTEFIDLLSKSRQPIQKIRAIAIEETKTAGPLKMRLVALSDNRIILTTASAS
ncbi:MAG: DUF3084 domain-containing protein [Cyanobacteria bacterium P01_E01_bin.42]